MNILDHFVFLEESRQLDTAIQAQYDFGLVFLSVFIAVFSSYLAFLVSNRIRIAEQYKYDFLWLWAGSLVLGLGIWAMHFIGMLAYTLPVNINYDVTLTIISVIPAIFSSLIVLKTTRNKNISAQSIFWRSILVGAGIGLMHYIGMSAMLVNGSMRYDLGFFVLSIFIATVLAYIALRLKLKADKYVIASVIFSTKLLVPALIMGCAISAMHYTGMAAMYVFPDSTEHFQLSTWSPDDLVKVITVITLLMSIFLLVAIEVCSRFDLYRKVKASEQNLAITLNSIADAVITTDATGLITRMNPVAEKLTGWSSQEAQGKHLNTVFSIINASTRETISNPVEKVIASGEVVHLSNHTTLISKTGIECQIADSAAPIIDDGHIVGMVLVFNDVTEQYQLREAASKSRRDMESIMDNSPAVIYVKDTQGRFTFVNHQFVELFDIKHDDTIDKTSFDIFSAAIAKEMERNDKSVLQSGKSIESEETFPHVDGLHTYSSIKFPLRDSNHNIYAVCGISTDITEKKEKDEQLRRSLKMDAIGKLTGGIAHDYNNMLGVILGYSELIKGMVDKQPEVSNYINQIQHAGERGANLTKKLLTFSRQKPSESNVINLNKLLQDSQLMLEKTMTVRINLVLDLEKKLHFVNLDINDLEDALLNMSINAMHAIDGQGKVTFITRNEILDESGAEKLQLVAGEYVSLTISDTGCGIDNEIEEKIFDPFYSTKGELGTGLGLSQVYSFVQRSKGNIKILSELGKGTAFRLYFPKCDDISSVEINEEDKMKNVSGDQSILVVDDETQLVELTSLTLTKQGYKVYRAHNAKEALELLEKEPVDLMFSDVVMPEIDGYQLASAVQRKYPNVKIQLTSGYNNELHVDDSNFSLHKNLLHKPYKAKHLLLKIRELLDEPLN